MALGRAASELVVEKAMMAGSLTARKNFLTGTLKSSITAPEHDAEEDDGAGVKASG